jgi:imidazolonepropionase-like amidohydrolase
VSKMASALLTDCRLATFALQPGGVSEMALVDDGTLVISGQTIAWAGPRSALPGQWKHLLPQSCGGGLLTAGLVDAFTGLHPGPAEGVSDDLYVAHALGLLDAVEVLCDDKVDDQTGAAFGFSFDDANRVLEAAYRNKIPTRMGCERHADTGGVALAPLFYARCAAYLNFCDKLGIEALAQARTTAMLLPLAQVPGQRRPPVDELRSHRIPIALGTAGANDDADSSATGHAAVRANPLLAARRACELYGLTAAQALAGITSAGSQVLAGPGADPRAGALDRGAPADLALWDAADPEALLQTEPPPLARRVWISGRRWI